jgi:hypothetical protein
MSRQKTPFVMPVPSALEQDIERETAFDETLSEPRKRIFDAANVAKVYSEADDHPFDLTKNSNRTHRSKPHRGSIAARSLPTFLAYYLETIGVESKMAFGRCGARQRFFTSADDIALR